VGLPALLLVNSLETGFIELLETTDSDAGYGRAYDGLVGTISPRVPLLKADSTEDMRVSETLYGTEPEIVFSESWYFDDATEDSDCFKEDTILLEDAVGKTFRELVPEIEENMLFRMPVEIGLSEGFSKGRVSVVISDDIADIVLLPGPSDFVLLSEPTKVDCFDSFGFPEEEGEDCLGGTITDDFSIPCKVAPAWDETELDEPKTKDILEMIFVDFVVEEVPIKLSVDSGALEGVTALGDWPRVEKPGCSTLELNDLKLEGICDTLAGMETVACPANEENLDDSRLGDIFKEAVSNGRPEGLTPGGPPAELMDGLGGKLVGTLNSELTLPDREEKLGSTAEPGIDDRSGTDGTLGVFETDGSLDGFEGDSDGMCVGSSDFRPFELN
jgi:hypothetical protein